MDAGSEVSGEIHGSVVFFWNSGTGKVASQEMRSVLFRHLLVNGIDDERSIGLRYGTRYHAAQRGSSGGRRDSFFGLRMRKSPPGIVNSSVWTNCSMNAAWPPYII